MGHMRWCMYDDPDHTVISPDAVIAIKYALEASRKDIGAVSVTVSIILRIQGQAKVDHSYPGERRH
jgi:hypothetical protein